MSNTDSPDIPKLASGPMGGRIAHLPDDHNGVVQLVVELPPALGRVEPRFLLDRTDYGGAEFGTPLLRRDPRQPNSVARHSQLHYAAPHFPGSRRHQKTCDLRLGKRRIGVRFLAVRA